MITTIVKHFTKVIIQVMIWMEIVAAKIKLKITIMMITNNQSAAIALKRNYLYIYNIIIKKLSLS